MSVDRGVAPLEQRLSPPRAAPFDGDPRLALVSVNFSTTSTLMLMLLSLAEQSRLDVLRRVVIVDNGSRDGGLPLLRALASRVPALHLVERRHWLHHAPGMRAGARALDRIDAGLPDAANVLLFCDPDVVFLDPLALEKISQPFRSGAALVGEVRRAGPDGPDIQASLFAVRRDVYARGDVYPLVHDGSPAMRHQASIRRAGLPVVDLRTNRDGLTLHRGRTAVAASGQYFRRHPYSTARLQRPHYMGVPDGEHTWATIEGRYAPLLQPQHSDELIALLEERLSRIGR